MGVTDESSAMHPNDGSSSILSDVMICKHYWFMPYIGVKSRPFVHYYQI